MFFVESSQKDAEKIKKLLKEKGLIKEKTKALKKNNKIYFAIKDRIYAEKMGFKIKKFNYEEKKKKNKSFRELLKEYLDKDEFKMAIKSYDCLGNIAIIKIPKELEKKEKEIAKLLLKADNKIKTVVKIKEHHKGVYRIQKYKYLAGKRSFKAKVKESSSVFEFNIAETFFSIRLSYERQRIAKLVKKDESVAVFFSGVAPFAIVIAKNSQAKEIYAIELNKKAHNYALRNISLNKVSDKVIALNKDVRDFSNEINKKFDRIVMPLPKDASLFIDSALKVSKKGTIIHLYEFVKKDYSIDSIVQELNKKAKEFSFKLKVLSHRKVRDYSPSVIQIVLDIKVI